MPLDYIDLHCDTAYELYHQKQPLESNTLAVSLDSASAYSHYAQFFAVWSDNRLDDESAWRDFLTISDHFTAQITADQSIAPVHTYEQLQAAWQSGKRAAFLAVEDARLLDGHLYRLDELARRGVRYLTLGWSGKSCICCSHDVPPNEDVGLTDFGRQVVLGCFERGILPDISHASEKTTDEVLTLAEKIGKPVIATHSNSYSVYPHTRNLRDGHAKRLFALGGLVGINLCEYHLRDCANARATVDDVLRHVDHWLALGGERHIAIGGDLDGAPLPDGIRNVGDIAALADAMATHGYSDTVIERIFSQNALDFIKKTLGGMTVR